MMKHSLPALLAVCLILSGCAATTPPQSQPASSQSVESSVAESSVVEPSIMEPSAVESSVAESSVVEPSAVEPPAAEPPMAPSPEPTPDSSAAFAMQSVYPSYCRDTMHIQVVITNHTGKEAAYGEWFALEAMTDGEWTRCPLVDPTWPMFPQMATLLPERASQTVMLGLYHFERPFPPGRYRVVKDLGGTLAAEFEITDELRERDQQWITALQALPPLAGVEFKRHNFSIPFYYEGLLSDAETSGVKLSLFYTPSEAEANERLLHIRAGGYEIDDMLLEGGKRVYSERPRFEWEDAPHFFQSGADILLYSGDDAKIIAALTARFEEELIPPIG